MAAVDMLNPLPTGARNADDMGGAPTPETQQRANPVPELSLYHIEAEKAALVAFRDECETDEERAAVDQQLQAYVEAEIRKVSNIAGLLRWLANMAEQAKAEQKRIAEIRASWERRRDHITNMVLGVMQALDLKKVECPTAKIRRQANPPAVHIYDTMAIEEKYLKVQVRMTASEWSELCAAAKLGMGIAKEGSLPLEMDVKAEIDGVSLKEACKAAEKEMVPCPHHFADGHAEDIIEGAFGPCAICSGTKQIPRTVPGARLNRGEHLRLE